MRISTVGLILCLWMAAVSPLAAASVSNSDQAVGDSLLSSNSGRLADAAAVLAGDLRPIIGAARGLPEDFDALVARVVDPRQGPLSPWLLALALAFAIGLGAEILGPRVLLRRTHRLLLSNQGDQALLARVLGVLGIDVLGVIALAVVAFAAHAWWFADPSVRSELATRLIAALVYWRVLQLVVDLVLRPGQPSVRLVDFTDGGARRLRRLMTCLIGLAVFSIEGLRALLHAGLPFASVQALAIPIGVVNALIAFAYLWRIRTAMRAAALRATSGNSQAAALPHRPSHAVLARIWYPAATLFVFAALLAWLFGVVTRDLDPFWGLVETAGLVVGIWVVETIVALWLQRAASLSATDKETPGTKKHWWSLMIGRCLALGLWLVAVAIAARLWLVDMFKVLSAARWEEYSGSALSAVVTLYVAYVLWQVVFIHTDYHITAPLEDSEGAQSADSVPPIASRLQTMLPLLRFFMLGTIAILAVLIALSALGINTTSLIAGASIFGLAISFGSQSLVRDIVSGIFFMADDAFRTGEYIDTGRLKGTVEGMSIRSLRLRHQNGQVHVIPFGQIQQVTNFSRDWTTVKFNLRLLHGTDLEKVRKTVKQIGVEMMEDPEIAPELIQPLKLQGVTEIDPSAIVVRLKFTARPIQPTFVYRRALMRIYTRFQEKDIGFANTNVVVQTATGAVSAEQTVEVMAASGAASRVAAPAGKTDAS